ncbi:maker334 [Drosophila busckii]|uniref:Maker334 n=1 Tax=Drosophila busckii TaxID=30019 RepID=A0A0M4EUF3_DROBS|nr:maker334 [Drosophila busckii]
MLSFTRAEQAVALIRIQFLESSKFQLNAKISEFLVLKAAMWFDCWDCLQFVVLFFCFYYIMQISRRDYLIMQQLSGETTEL